MVDKDLISVDQIRAFSDQELMEAVDSGLKFSNLAMESVEYEARARPFIFTKQLFEELKLANMKPSAETHTEDFISLVLSREEETPSLIDQMELMAAIDQEAGFGGHISDIEKLKETHRKFNLSKQILMPLQSSFEEEQMPESLQKQVSNLLEKNKKKVTEDPTSTSKATPTVLAPDPLPVISLLSPLKKEMNKALATAVGLFGMFKLQSLAGGLGAAALALVAIFYLPSNDDSYPLGSRQVADIAGDSEQKPEFLEEMWLAKLKALVPGAKVNTPDWFSQDSDLIEIDTYSLIAMRGATSPDNLPVILSEMTRKKTPKAQVVGISGNKSLVVMHGLAQWGTNNKDKYSIVGAILSGPLKNPSQYENTSFFLFWPNGKSASENYTPPRGNRANQAVLEYLSD
jgi:hypothetical protein